MRTSSCSSPPESNLSEAPASRMAISVPDEYAHTPNEKLDLDNLYHGMLSAAYLFDELAGTGKSRRRQRR